MMNVDSGDRFIKVFVHEKDGRTSYTAGISKKDQNGNYQNMYIRLNFKKSEEPNFKESGLIKIKKGFLSFSEWKEIKYPNIVVLEYVLDNNAVSKEEAEEFAKEVELTDDDLPF